MDKYKGLSRNWGSKERKSDSRSAKSTLKNVTEEDADNFNVPSIEEMIKEEESRYKNAIEVLSTISQDEKTLLASVMSYLKGKAHPGIVIRLIRAHLRNKPK